MEGFCYPKKQKKQLQKLSPFALIVELDLCPNTSVIFGRKTSHIWTIQYLNQDISK